MTAVLIISLVALTAIITHHFTELKWVNKITEAAKSKQGEEQVEPIYTGFQSKGKFQVTVTAHAEQRINERTPYQRSHPKMNEVIQTAVEEGRREFECPPRLRAYLNEVRLRYGSDISPKVYKNFVWWLNETNRKKPVLITVYNLTPDLHIK